jgi:hypothetical protein
MSTYSSNKNCRSKSHSSTVGNCMENKTWTWFFSVLVSCISSRKIFEFQDMENEKRFLGTFRSHSKQPRCGCTLRVTSQTNLFDIQQIFSRRSQRTWGEKLKLAFFTELPTSCTMSADNTSPHEWEKVLLNLTNVKT